MRASSAACSAARTAFSASRVPHPSASKRTCNAASIAALAAAWAFAADFLAAIVDRAASAAVADCPATRAESRADSTNEPIARKARASGFSPSRAFSAAADIPTPRLNGAPGGGSKISVAIAAVRLREPGLLTVAA